MPINPEAVDQIAADRRAKLETQERLLQFFQYAHLPDHLAVVSAPYCRFAYDIVEHYPRNPERTVCLRKLLECKDAAVRTFLHKET